MLFFLHQLLLEKEFQNYTWHQAFPVRKRTEKEFPLDSHHPCPPATFHKVLDHPSFTCINLGTKAISWQVLGTESWEHTWMGSRKWPYLKNHGLQSWSVRHQSDSWLIFCQDFDRMPFYLRDVLHWLHQGQEKFSLEEPDFSLQTMSGPLCRTGLSNQNFNDQSEFTQHDNSVNIYSPTCLCKLSSTKTQKEIFESQ